MSDLLKKIEKEVVEELIAKFPSDNEMSKFMSQVVKVSAQVTRTIIEKYEVEKNKTEN